MGKKQKSYSADIKVRVALEAMRSQKNVPSCDEGLFAAGANLYRG